MSLSLRKFLLSLILTSFYTFKKPYMCRCFTDMYVHEPYVFSVHSGQKRTLDSLKLELQTVASHHVGARNREEQPVLLQADPPLQHLTLASSSIYQGQFPQRKWTKQSTVHWHARTDPCCHHTQTICDSSLAWPLWVKDFLAAHYDRLRKQFLRARVLQMCSSSSESLSNWIKGSIIKIGNGKLRIQNLDSVSTKKNSRWS